MPLRQLPIECWSIEGEGGAGNRLVVKTKQRHQGLTTICEMREHLNRATQLGRHKWPVGCRALATETKFSVSVQAVSVELEGHYGRRTNLGAELIGQGKYCT